MKIHILCGLFLLIFGIGNAQTIEVSFPNGGEHFINNTWAPHNITWSASGISTFKLEYSLNAGSDWILIEDNYSGGNYYSWETPVIESGECLIRVSESGGSVFDISDATFTVSAQNRYIAEWNTTMGLFRAELRGDLVPMTAQNFINLTEKGFYTDLIFHRVISGFMIQDGCPYGNGTGDPGYEFNDEFSPLLRHSFPGVLSMANAGPNTNGSQYFITVAPTAWLDDVHSVFGRIIDGMDVVYAISEVETDSNDKPLTDVVLSIDIVQSNPQLSLINPYDGMYLEVGRSVNIAWESNFVSDVEIAFSSDNGLNWATLTDSIPADEEHFVWVVPNSVSSECLIKITDLNDPSVYCQTVTPFTIREQPVVLNRFELYENVIPHVENPDNLVMPDRIIRFNINIENLSGNELSSPYAYIVSYDQQVSILNDTVYFENISESANEWSIESFEIQTPEDFPFSGQYSFSIFGFANGISDEYWIADFNIPVIKKFPFLTVDDDNNPDSHGNGNHIAEPDETVELTVLIDNPGDETLFNVYGQLSSEADFIDIWNAVNGAGGMVYDTTSYNNGNPINPGAAGQSPIHDFVFDYTADEIFQTPLMIKVFGYLYEEEGVSWDQGGVKIIWGIPLTLNTAYPPAAISETESDQNDWLLRPNPANDFIIIQLISNAKQITQPTIELFDIYGRIVYSGKYSPGSENVYIDLTKLNRGIYTLRFNKSTKMFIHI